MSREDDEWTVHRLFAALDSGDMAGVLDAYADDAELQLPPLDLPVLEAPPAMPRRGRQELARYFRELDLLIETEETTVTDLASTDDCVVVEGWTSGTVLSTGRDFRQDWIAFLTLRGGKLVRHQQYERRSLRGGDPVGAEGARVSADLAPRHRRSEPPRRGVRKSPSAHLGAER